MNKDPIQIDLSEAKICIDCELIFDQVQQCPRCNSLSWQWLARWIAPIRKRREQYE